ncbi:MAG: hypothetical protein MJE77_14330, partial [Proteobacteria bacterium]|nr:hypothetical protein [Pseudomonadota bacterium]
MIYYQGLRLERASESRKDPKWVRRQWTRQQCRVFVFRQNKSLMLWPDRPATYPRALHLPRADVETLVESHQDGIFLGFEGDVPLFALDFTEGDETLLAQIASGHEFVDLREIGWLL